MLKSLVKRVKRPLGERKTAWRDASSLDASERSAPLELVVADKPNDDWRDSQRGSRISFVSHRLLSPGDRVFTMGSCFAVEIRKALIERGYDAYPHYDKIAFDPQAQTLAKLPERDNINHYNTFVIRQEFERAIARTNYALTDLVRFQSVKPGTFHRWQDPYRKAVFAADETGILDLSAKITDCIATAIERADVLIITLGLTEVWRNEANGLYLNQAPREMASGNYSFVESTFQQNFDNMRKVCSLVAEHYPDKRIILTVSPVPLSRTFSGRDIVVANTESKSILRAVAAEISKVMGNVTYWPSYEIALARDLFEADGRHVRRDGVGLIVDQFLKVHT